MAFYPTISSAKSDLSGAELIFSIGLSGNVRNLLQSHHRTLLA